MNWTEVSSVVDWAMTGRDHFFFDVLLTFLACFATVIYGTLCKSGHGLPKDPPARTIVACMAGTHLRLLTMTEIAGS